MTKSELSCYADDILGYLGKSTYSLPKLMQSFEHYSELSGYKINCPRRHISLNCVDTFMSFGISFNKIFLLYGLSCMILAHIDFSF